MLEWASPPPGHAPPPPAWLYLVPAGVATALNLNNVLLHPLAWLPTAASAAGPRCPEWPESRSAGSQSSNLLHSLLETHRLDLFYATQAPGSTGRVWLSLPSAQALSNSPPGCHHVGCSNSLGLDIFPVCTWSKATAGGSLKLPRTWPSLRGRSLDTDVWLFYLYLSCPASTSLMK